MSLLEHNPCRIWWLDPVWGFSLSGLVVLAAQFTPGEAYLDEWGTPKQLTPFFSGYLLLLVLCAVAGALAVRSLPHTTPSEATYNNSPGLPLGSMAVLFQLSFWLCVVGYVAWAGVAVQRGLDLRTIIAMLTASQPGVSDNIKETYLETVVGVTTLTQFGISAIVLGTLLGIQTGWRAVRWPMSTLFGMALLRAVINSERLAVIEIAVPMLVLILAFRISARDRTRRANTLLRLAPLLGVSGLYLLFVAFEYFRSWSNYYSGEGISLWRFCLYRLIGYYVLAQNNAAIMTSFVPEPGGSPFMTLNFLWRLPVLGNLLQSLALPANDDYFGMLDRSGNREFNNFSGLISPLVDFGMWGAMAYWMLAGAACGMLYRQFIRRTPSGLCLFPLSYLGVLEVSRGLYWAGGRAFPPACMLLICTLLFHSNRRNARAESVQDSLGARLRAWGEREPASRHVDYLK